MQQDPPKLEYRSQESPQRPSTPVIVQGLCGVLAVGITLGLIFALLNILPPRLIAKNDSGYVAILLPLGFLIFAAIYTSIRWRWRGFVAGVLIGFGLSCLIGVGLCFAALRNI